MSFHKVRLIFWSLFLGTQKVWELHPGHSGHPREQPVLGATARKRFQMETESLLELVPKEATVKLPWRHWCFKSSVRIIYRQKDPLGSDPGMGWPISWSPPLGSLPWFPRVGNTWYNLKSMGSLLILNWVVVLFCLKTSAFLLFCKLYAELCLSYSTSKTLSLASVYSPVISLCLEQCQEQGRAHTWRNEWKKRLGPGAWASAGHHVGCDGWHHLSESTVSLWRDEKVYPSL